MICLPRNQPLLSVGDLPLEPFPEGWLRERIDSAARRAGRDGFWMAEQVARGVMEYLERDYQGSVIALPALLERVRALLTRIDCGDIAAELDGAPPPVTLPLPEFAAAAGDGYELQFFQHLRDHLHACAAQGVQTVRVAGLRACVRRLRHAGKWRKDCEVLAQEILAFIASHELATQMETSHDLV